MLTASTAAFVVFADEEPCPPSLPVAVERKLDLQQEMPLDVYSLLTKSLDYHGITLQSIRMYEDLVYAAPHDLNPDDMGLPLLLHQWIVVFELKQLATSELTGQCRFEISTLPDGESDVGFSRVPMQRTGLKLCSLAKQSNNSGIMATITAIYAACLVWTNFDPTVTPRQVFDNLQTRMHPRIELALLEPQPLWVMTFVLSVNHTPLARFVDTALSTNQIPVLGYKPSVGGKLSNATHDHARILWTRARSNAVCYTTTSSLCEATLRIETENWIQAKIGMQARVHVITKPYDTDVANLPH